MEKREMLVQFIKSVLARMKIPYISILPATIAFYLTFAIVPVAILMGKIVLAFSDELLPIIETIPIQINIDELYKLVENASYNRGSTFQDIFFIVVLLWVASKAVFAVKRASNLSYGFEERRYKLVDRVISLFLAFIMTLTGAFSAIVVVVGQKFIDFVIRLLNLENFVEGPMYQLVELTKWSVGIVLIFISIAILYKISPNRKVKFKNVVPGSLFVTFSWGIASFAFSIYINNFTSNYSIVYGSLQSLVVLVFWLYIMSYVLVIGIQINIVWQERKTWTKGI